MRIDITYRCVGSIVYEVMYCTHTKKKKRKGGFRGVSSLSHKHRKTRPYTTPPARLPAVTNNAVCGYHRLIASYHILYS